MAAEFVARDPSARLVRLRVEGTSRSLPARWGRRVLRVALALASGATVRLARARGRTVVWDRHPFEDRMAARLGRSVPRSRRAMIPRWIPDPDLVIVLDVPVETLHARRPELSATELETRRATYLDLAARSPLAHVVDATATPDLVVERIRQLVNRYRDGTWTAIGSDTLSPTGTDGG
jgi:hypothetical protein